MSLLDISEHSSLSLDSRGTRVPAPKHPARQTQQLAVGASSVASAAFESVTFFVRVHTDVACRVAFGPAPTASSASMRLAANQTEYFGVFPGHKIAVIQDGGGGGGGGGDYYSSSSFQSLRQISGGRAIGSVWGVDLGTLAVQTIAYQWTRDGVDIPGATSSTYTTVGADGDTLLGCTITCSIAGVIVLPTEYITP